MMKTIILYFILFSCLFGCASVSEKKGEKLLYGLVFDQANIGLEEVDKCDWLGTIHIEPNPAKEIFKVTVYLEKQVDSKGYQLFVDGESNYKLMEYGKSYFIGTPFKEGMEVELRMVKNGKKYHRLDLVSLPSETNSANGNVGSFWLIGKLEP